MIMAEQLSAHWTTIAWLSVCIILFIAVIVFWRIAGRLDNQANSFFIFLHKTFGVKISSFPQAKSELSAIADQLHNIETRPRQEPLSSPTPLITEKEERQDIAPNRQGGQLYLPGFADSSPVEITTSLNRILKELESVNSYRELDQVLGLGVKLQYTAKLILKLSTPNSEEDEKLSENIDLCFSEGGFDLIVTLPGFLNAYYQNDESLTPLRNIVSLLVIFVQDLAAKRKIKIASVTPLNLISRDDKRLMAHDVRGIAKLPPVMNTVRRMVINLHDDQSLITDCPVPEISRVGKILRKGQVAIYNHSGWV